jgi:hypothetical protein
MQSSHFSFTIAQWFFAGRSQKFILHEDEKVMRAEAHPCSMMDAHTMADVIASEPSKVENAA